MTYHHDEVVFQVKFLKVEINLTFLRIPICQRQTGKAICKPGQGSELGASQETNLGRVQSRT